MYLNKNTVQTKVKGVNVIYHFENSAIAGLSEEAFELLAKIASDPFFKPNLKNKDIKELLQFLMENNFLSIKPFTYKKTEIASAYVHLTNQCNLHCKGCYSFNDRRNAAIDLKTEIICQGLRQLKEVGTKTVVFSGGEPLLRKDIIEISKFAKKDCQFEQIILITNGTFNRVEIFSELAKYIDTISVSVDAYAKDSPSFIRDEGIFKKTIETIQQLKQLGIEVNILPTIHHLNAKKIRKYLELAEQLATNINYSLLSACATEELKDLLFKDKDLIFIANFLRNANQKVMDTPINKAGLEAKDHCGAGKTILSIGTNGNVYPCHMLMSDNYCMGNIQNLHIKDMLIQSSVAKQFSDLSVDQLNSSCFKCEFKYFCGGGCRARSVMINKNLYQKDPYCKLYFNYYDKETEFMTYESSEENV
jgi:radical SAM protein with 4Fe4S-binding SPASM domain